MYSAIAFSLPLGDTPLVPRCFSPHGRPPGGGSFSRAGRDIQLKCLFWSSSRLDYQYVKRVKFTDLSWYAFMLFSAGIVILREDSCSHSHISRERPDNWQGCRDSNPNQAVLETAMLHYTTPLYVLYAITHSIKQSLNNCATICSRFHFCQQTVSRGIILLYSAINCSLSCLST